MVGHFIDLGLGIIKTVVLLHPHFRHLNILMGFETGMFQHFFRASHPASVDPHDHLSGFGGLDHPADMAPDAGQAEHPARPVLSQFESSQVGDLPHIRAAGAGKDKYLIGFAKALFFHGLLLLSLDHFFDLFHGGELPGHFHDSIHHQGRGDHYPVAADLFDVFYL
jgi:hypothetical protein